MSTPSTPAKVGQCSSCGATDAQFSKSQWKKTAGMRKCIICVAAGELNPSHSNGNANNADKAANDNGNSTAVTAASRLTFPDTDDTKKQAANTSIPGSKSDEENEGNWSPMQSDNEDEKPSHKPKESIRDKIKRIREDALGTNNKRLKTEHDASSDEDNNNISVEQLKQKILGRSIHSYDVNIESQNFNQSGMILDPSVFADGNTVADHLRPHLSCPICYERLFNPVSLLCGHSFCKKCLVWWVDRAGKGEESDDETLQVFGTCPSCRHQIVGESKSNLFQINTALKSCMDTLFGAEMNQRRLTEQREERKAVRGENGGTHNRGCEEIVSLPKEDEIAWGNNGMKDEENGWISLYASSDRGRRSTAYIRRNIILDDCDQQFQVSLAFTKCFISKGNNGCIVDVELCLLRMEEDEIDDSGFPTLVAEGSDDEALICTSNDRIHTCIESSARIAPAAAFEKKEFSCFANEDSNEKEIKEVPLSRGMIGSDGSVRFRIDAGRVLEDEARDETSAMKDPKLIKLIFMHVDTGAVLELRAPLKFETEDDAHDDHSDGEIEYGGTRRQDGRNKASKFVVDAYEEEEEDSNEPNEYEMDDFVVDCSQDTDDEEGCDICNQHGDLIVCDGGEEAGGCGKSFHLECISRSEVPPGDWICKDCANEVGFKVGIEGYEYSPEDADVLVGADSDNESSAVDLTDTPEKPRQKWSSKKTIQLNDSDDSDQDEETPVGRKKNNSKSKKRIIDLEDSDDE
ncbi:hypothetical protein ACHAXN_012047 [Cyclotella atomus]